MEKEHYLKKELYELVSKDPNIFEFLEKGALDGIWYWDIENMENEWMSERFWLNFGYDPKTKKHLASEWQDIINQDDLKLAVDNFQKHCDDPKHPYDQVVRYTKADGSISWVRCRGIGIRDKDGKVIRFLGVHIDVSELKQREQELNEKIDELSRLNKLMINRELKMINMKKEIQDLRQELKDSK